MLDRVEAPIRAYDPCLSRSTHGFGENAEAWDEAPKAC
jgi:coenzyme F420-reducing hydrogenase alpha subunit